MRPCSSFGHSNGTPPADLHVPYNLEVSGVGLDLQQMLERRDMEIQKHTTDLEALRHRAANHRAMLNDEAEKIQSAEWEHQDQVLAERSKLQELIQAQESKIQELTQTGELRI